jgi:peptide/nickel transport system substrate-binding protein
MVHHWSRKPRHLEFIPLLLVLMAAVACGAAATPTPGPTTAPGPITTATQMPGVTPQPTPTPPTPLERAKRGGIVSMQAAQAPQHFNIYECNNISTCAVGVIPLYNQIVEFNPETDELTDISGDLAKSWELAPDGMTYIFHLHNNAQWHDGKPVTAADVVFSLDSMADPVLPRPLVGDLKPYYKSSRAIDSKTVEVTTKFPSAAFLPYLTVEMMKIWPKHHVETGVDMKLPQNQLGSGPFKLVEYKRDVSFEYTRNPNYFKEGKPYFDGLKYFIIIDHGSIIAAFKAGQVLMSTTMVSNLNNAEALQLEKDMQGKGKVYWGGPVGMAGLLVNVSVKPFDDVRVRRAIALALHRQAFVKTFSAGMDFIGTPFQPNFWYYLTEAELAKLLGYRELNGEKHPEDIAEARRLLAEAGFPNGFETTLLARTIVEFVDMNALIGDQLKKFLNINATIKVVDSATGLAAYDKGDFELSGTGSATLVPDPDAVFSQLYLKRAVRNYTHVWFNPRIEEIYELQARELDPEKRKALILETDKILREVDIPTFIGLYWSMRSWYVDNRIKNFHVPPSLYAGLKHEHLWLER